MSNAPQVGRSSMHRYLSGAKEQTSQRNYNIVVLGTGGVGKSSLTSQLVHQYFPESYDPTIEDSYRTVLEVDGRHVILEILDTAGTEQFTAMRELYMKSGKGFLLVFSITSPSSLRELQDLHTQLLDIKQHDPSKPHDIPLVLVGNKADLADYRTVSHQRALAMSRRWGDTPYYETSAKARMNVDEVFVDLCRQIIRKDMVVDDGMVNGNGKAVPPHRRRGSRKRRRRRADSPSRCVIL